MATPSLLVFELSGDEASAKKTAAAEFQRIASQPAPTSSGQTATKFLAIDLASNGDPYYVHEPQLLNLPLDSKDELAAKMALELEDVYAVGGLVAANAISDHIRDAASIQLMLLTSKTYKPSYDNPTKFSSRDEVLEAAITLHKAWEVAMSDLQKKVDQVQRGVEQKASSIATSRLSDAAQEILAETSRYVGNVKGLDGSEVQSLMSSNKPAGQMILDVDGTAPLIGALRRIAKQKDALNAASSALDERKGSVNAEYLLSRLWVDPAELVVGMSPEQARAMYPSESRDVEDAATAVADRVFVECETFPILYRVWNSVVIPESVNFIQLPTGEYRVSAVSAAGGKAVAELTASVWNTLRDSYQSNLVFASDINGDKSLVWRYPPLVDAALEELGFEDPSLEFQAAQERLEAEEGPDVASIVSMIVGALDGAAVLLGAVPEVLVAFAVITAVADAISSVIEFRKTLQAERAFHSVLNPSKAPASDPSYVGLLVNVTATLMDLKGFANAVRTARYASEASAAQKAFEVIGTQ